MNFFTWIREGVRQAVLYGVNDAVGDIGTPPSGDDVSQRILEVLRTAPSEAAPQLAGPAAAAQPARRRKLGRSLSEIQSGTGEVEG